jgi:hypothetical protein
MFERGSKRRIGLEPAPIFCDACQRYRSGELVSVACALLTGH